MQRINLYIFSKLMYQSEFIKILEKYYSYKYLLLSV